jgi:cytochrome c oxidase subunit 3
MTILALYLVFLAAVFGWWVTRQGLTVRPWLNEGVAALPAPRRPDAAGTCLIVFFGVAGSLFALLVTAYFMRIGGDWVSVPKPRLLWLNTDVLFAASLCLYWADRGARQDDLDQARMGLVCGGFAGLIFTAGQILAWRELSLAGNAIGRDPASSLFYLLTGLHALHVLGGLVALARTGAASWGLLRIRDVAQSIRLCALYWHFLLVIWLVLFCVLMVT